MINQIRNSLRYCVSNRVECIILVILVLFALLAQVAWYPYQRIVSSSTLYDLRIDASTVFLIPHLIGQGLQLGKDVVWPYGPFGFIKFNYYHPITYYWMILGQIYLSLVFSVTCWTLIRHYKNRLKLLAMTLFGMVLIFYFREDPFLGSFTLLLVINYCFVDQGRISPLHIMLLVASAVVTLVKVSMFGMAFANVSMIALYEIFYNKKFPVSLLVFLIAFLLFWLASGQSLANLPAYLSWMKEVGGGYTEAMSYKSPTAHRLWEIILYVISCALLLSVLTGLLKRQFNPLRTIPIASVMLLMFATFKHSFVRHDAHAVEAAITLMFFMFVFMALAEKYDNRAYRYRPIFAAWLLLSLVTIVLVFYDYKQFKINPMTALRGQAAGVVSLLQHGTSPLQAGYNLQVESIRATVQLPEVRGPVDLYPDNLAIVAALDLPYNPRPSVISHGAYTPLMARLDAEHLTGSRQPETILFDVDTIDNRYAPIDDGLSWPELWTRYEVDTVSKFFVVLSHLEKPSTYTMSKIREDSIKFGSKLDLPGIENGLIWAEIDMQKTMPGRFGVIAFKLPEVRMTVTFRNGQAQTYRVIPEMLKTGFLLSPYINSKHLFVDAMDRRWAEILKQHEIRDITFQLENWWGKTSSPGLYYKDDIKVSLYRLDFPRQDVWKKLGVRTEDIIELTTLFGSASGCYDKRFTTDTLTGKRVLLAHANCELRLPVTKNLSNLKVSFGLMESAYSDEGRAGAVEFRISAVTSGGGRKIVFSRNLDPLAVHGDRGEKEAIVKFSGGNNVKELVFETLTKGKTRWADSYWSRVSPQYK